MKKLRLLVTKDCPIMLNICTCCGEEYDSYTPEINDDDLCPTCYKQVFIDPSFEDLDEPLIFSEIPKIETLNFEDLD